MKIAGGAEVPVAGLVLAAGAGRRMGTPKALVRDPDGVAWVVRTSRLLTEAGCSPVVVVIGAAAAQVRVELSNEPVQLVEAPDWTEGMAASLRTGLTALHALPTTATPTSPAPTTGSAPTATSGSTAGSAPSPGSAPRAGSASSAPAVGSASTAFSAGTGWPEAVVVVPVDVPGLTAAAVRRVADRVGLDQVRAEALVRATYRGAPGHPVLIGRAHWDGVIASARGDEGGRAYLRDHQVELVECADIADGSDVDTPHDLPTGHG